MGRTSKFSFPLPGRRHASTTDNNSPLNSPSSTSSAQLKAQRILGSERDLNIDSPTWEEAHKWWNLGSRPSGVSISIAESINDGGSVPGSRAGKWEYGADMFPSPQQVRGKASSTLLGQRYLDDGETDASSTIRRMRHEDSSSTLKSHYDRQKSPLSISQQTSASSARDLALRKGFPPLVPRSPLLQVQSSTDPFAQHFTDGPHGGDPSQDKTSRKKPARLDLSMLFPRARKLGGLMLGSESSTASVSSSSTYTSADPRRQDPNSSRRKLRKAPSRESIQSQGQNFRPNKPQDPAQRHAGDTGPQLYNRHEHLPTRSPHMSQIPESRVPDHPEMPLRREGRLLEIHHPMPEPPKNPKPHLGPADPEPFSWKNVRSSAVPPPWELSSAASISSRNTKTSRRTSGSAFSNSDLQQNSVLSLSSDSEGDASETSRKRSPGATPTRKTPRGRSGGTSQRSSEGRRQSSQKSLNSQLLPKPREHAPKKNPAQSSPFLTIPEASSTSARISGPWSLPQEEAPRGSSSRERRSSKKPPTPLSSRRSPQQPTPPLSPKSVELHKAPQRSSRFMAVTKQEEALLEALRNKRALMREKIIEEHESTRSPPRLPSRSNSRLSESSSVPTVRGLRSVGDREQILLYLDTPISEERPIDTAEPSPDLSDFLSFGSDEDSTPRRTVAPSKGDPRPDSRLSPDRHGRKSSPMTPPSAARLSAVGAVSGFGEEPAADQGTRAKKRSTNAGVRFVDEGKVVLTPDFLLDDNESEGIWGL